jgi:hypothetical protein
MRDNGGEGEAPGAETGRPDDRTRASLLALGGAIAGLNERVEILGSFTGSNAADVATALRDLAALLDAQDRRISALEAVLVALGKAAGLAPERGNRTTTH